MFALLDSKAATTAGCNVHWLCSDKVSPRAPDSHPRMSALDLLAAPTVFIQQALVYERDLDSSALRGAIQDVVDIQPLLAARLSQDEDGHPCLVLDGKSAGLLLLQGQAAGLQLQHITPHSTKHQQQQLQQDLSLTQTLFGHLPGALLPDYKDSDSLALTYIAHVRLDDGASVLGFRVSHFLGDWTSMRLLIQSVAAAYSRRIGRQQQQHQVNERELIQPSAGPQPTSVTQNQPLVHASPLLNQLVLDARNQLPTDFAPMRFRLHTPQDDVMFSKVAEISSSSTSGSKPTRLTYHVLPDRIQQLKADFIIVAAAAAAGSGSLTNQSWCSTHNVILARVLQAFIRLPGRQKMLHDVSIAVDMRQRVPQQYLQRLPFKQQQLLQHSVGNFFASAIYEGCCGADGLSSWQLAQSLYTAVQRVQEFWLPDLAWTSSIMGLSAAQLKVAEEQTNTAVVEMQRPGLLEGTGGLVRPAKPTPQQQQPKQRITWSRLHAMGPSQLLPQQVQLGLLPSLSTTQWPLDFATDTYMAGQLPLYAEPSFSQPQPYPLVLMQHAPVAAGGGMMVHVYLDEVEAGAMQQQMAQGGI